MKSIRQERGSVKKGGTCVCGKSDECVAMLVRFFIKQSWPRSSIVLYHKSKYTVCVFFKLEVDPCSVWECLVGED